MIDLTQTITIAELMVATGTMQAEINELKASKYYWYKAFWEKEKELAEIKERIDEHNTKIINGDNDFTIDNSGGTE